MNDARFADLVAAVAPLGVTAWIVGGGVRDALLGRPVTDLDVAVPGDARVPSRALARRWGAGRFELSAEFGSWRVQGGDLPFSVDLTPLQGATIDEDLGSRDFTVNALAYPVGDAHGRVLDLHGGLRDLAERRIRLVGDEAFAADPVRLVRAARFASQLGFAIDTSTIRRAREDASSLWSVPPERIWEELRRILRLGRPAEALEHLDALGVLAALVPALDDARGLGQNPFHHKDVLGHTLEVVRRVADLSRDPEPVFRSRAARVADRLATPLAEDLTTGDALVLAALLHDVAKPATREVHPDGRVTFRGHDRLGAEMTEDLCRRLRTANRTREFVALCVRQHLPLGFMVHRQPLSLRQIVRYLDATSPAQVELIVLSVADRLATAGPRTSRSAIDRHLDLARRVLAVEFDLEDSGPLPQLVPGDELARQLRREPGPWLAELLAAVREEQLVGRVTTPDRALQFSQKWAAERFAGPGGLA